MKTFYNKLAVLSLLGFVLAACGTSNNVVSGHLISKRKVNKGFFINHSKTPKSEGPDVQEARQPFIQYSPEQAGEELAVTGNEALEVGQELAFAEESYTSMNDAAPLEAAGQETAVAKKNVEHTVEKTATVSENRAVKTKIDRSTKTAFRQAKKDYGQSGHDDGVRLLILVIICLFIPPLAVYLSEGRWNSTCWINLLLTLLFFLPGLIHGLIVILT